MTDFIYCGTGPGQRQLERNSYYSDHSMSFGFRQGRQRLNQPMVIRSGWCGDHLSQTCLSCSAAGG